MRVDLFDFDLPEERIALRPVAPKDSAKMLVVDPNGENGLNLSNYMARDLPKFLRAGDAIVFNDTKVIPAQLEGTRSRPNPQGGDSVAQISATLHMRTKDNIWLAFVRGAKKLVVGDSVKFGNDTTPLNCTVTAKGDEGEVEFTFDLSGADLDEALVAVGHIPLPPYIALKRAEDEQDRKDYQTIYAKDEGAVAAPTAGLHFTDELLVALEAKGIEKHFVTLHVGAGTFLPVKVDDTNNHKMHFERGIVSAQTAAALNAVKAKGGRIISVGTTSLRLLESAANDDGLLQPWEGATDVFITPGYNFKFIDILMTNFHLPKSTLMMLVSAFSGMEVMQKTYTYAIENSYRFYSYGDASLLFRPKNPAQKSPLK